MTSSAIILGAGGLASEVRWYISDCDPGGSSFRFAGFVVSDVAHLSSTGDTNVLTWDDCGSVDQAFVGVGNPILRESLVKGLVDRYPHVRFPSLVHPTVIFDGKTTTIGEGVVLAPGVIATVRVEFMPFCFVNLAVTIGHGSTIGEYSVVNPGASISGDVRIGRSVLVGSGATILEKITIGDGAIIGAGAVVTRNVSPGLTVVGIPARPIN